MELIVLFLTAFAIVGAMIAITWRWPWIGVAWIALAVLYQF